MSMTPRFRKFALTAHVTSSVGWLGAVVAYLALAIAGLTSPDAQTVRSAYFAMELIGWFVLVPCSLTALITGLVQSLGTEWGLFRHYWILVKFLSTVGSITVLLLHLPAVSRMAGLTAETTMFGVGFDELRPPTFVVHAGGGLLVLMALTALSVYKPWGRTPYGRRMESQPIPLQRPATLRNLGGAPLPDRRSHPDSNDNTGVRTDRESRGNPPWGLNVLFGIIGLVLLFVILHLIRGGFGGHPSPPSK